MVFIPESLGNMPVLELKGNLFALLRKTDCFGEKL